LYTALNKIWLQIKCLLIESIYSSFLISDIGPGGGPPVLLISISKWFVSFILFFILFWRILGFEKSAHIKSFSFPINEFLTLISFVSSLEIRVIEAPISEFFFAIA